MVQYVFTAYDNTGGVVSSLRYQAHTLGQVLQVLDTFARDSHIDKGAVRITSDIAL